MKRGVCSCCQRGGIPLLGSGLLVDHLVCGDSGPRCEGSGSEPECVLPDSPVDVVSALENMVRIFGSPVEMLKIKKSGDEFKADALRCARLALDGSSSRREKGVGDDCCDSAGGL